MTKEKIPAEFIVKLPIRNEAGHTVGEKEFITYAGLLAVAHDMGLAEMETTLLQAPDDANGRTAIVRATARGKPGAYSGLGDASPENVNRKVARHLLRVAETRAKARALRDFTNIAMVALEELGGDEDVDPVDSRAAAPPGARKVVRSNVTPRSASTGLATDAQRRALWRKVLALGYEGHDAEAFLTERLGVEPGRATKEQASRLLDELAHDERRGPSGGVHAAE